MRKIAIGFILTAGLLGQPAFSHDDMSSNGKAECKSIVKACMKAGYVRKDTESKRFWQDCMSPILLDKTVSGVKVSADTVKDCRDFKIKELTNELNDLQSVAKS